MSILLREGIKALSQLEIDVDKDWLRFGIHNIKEVVEGMGVGDIIARGSEVLVKISPGLAGYVLTSSGPGKLPAWMPPPQPGIWYFPAWLELQKSVGTITPEKLIEILAAPLTTSYPIQETPNAVATPYSSREAVVIIPDEEISKTPTLWPQLRDYDLLLDGAIAYYGVPPVEHDQLTASRNDVANDMHLPPQNGTIPPNECYYFGNLLKFSHLWIDVSRAGVGNFALDIRYWDGDSWEIPPNLVDNMNDFQTLGVKDFNWTIPGDWATATIGGYTLYWVRVACVSMVNLDIAPLGRRAWVRIPYP